MRSSPVLHSIMNNLVLLVIINYCLHPTENVYQWLRIINCSMNNILETTGLLGLSEVRRLGYIAPNCS